MMKNFPALIISVILVIWITVIAIISVQNATLVSLKFMGFESVQIPVGVVLALSVNVGIIAGIIFVPLWLMRD